MNQTETSQKQLQFLYCYRGDDGSSGYCFRASRGRQRYFAYLQGSDLETPASFDCALLEQTPGLSFFDNEYAFDEAQNRWFSGGVVEVRSLPFVGYDRKSGAYIFPQWACCQGKIMTNLEDGYFRINEHRVVCIPNSFHPDNYNDPYTFSPDWINDYNLAFGMEGVVVLGWWLGTLFAEQIRQKYGFWPVLELADKNPSNVAGMIEFLWRCCGRDNYYGFSPSRASLVGRSRSMRNVSNLPVVMIDEHVDCGEKWDYKDLATLYLGRIPNAVGSRYYREDVEDSAFRGGLMIVNREPFGDEIKQTVLVEIESEKTLESKRAADRLRSLRSPYLGGLLVSAVSKEHELLEEFDRQFEAIAQTFLSHKGISESILYNHAMVAAWCKTLPLLFPDFPGSCLDYVNDYLFASAIEAQAELEG